MLVLTRKLNEAIWLGDAIRITVIDVKGSKVRLGIEAPQEVSIRRGELPAPDSFGCHAEPGVTAPRSLACIAR
ncbi:MAG: carbon storage regulator [Planctomycetaceae bacterium]